MNKIINIIITILIIITLPLKIYNQEYFNTYTNILWIIASILLISSSIYFTKKLNFIQFNLKKIIKSLRHQPPTSLFLSLGAKIGVGSISGIAIAIHIAGPGIIFWLWIFSALFSIITYCESYLGLTYGKGIFSYLKKGLNNKALTIIYAITLIISYVIGFIGIQSNTITKSISYQTTISPLIISLITSLIILIIIFKKTSTILKIISNLVPIMCLIYIISGITIIAINIENLTSITLTILTSALTPQTTTKSLIIISLQRTIFATESGLGTTSIASHISTSSPQKESLTQVFGVHFTSLIICTITTLIVLSNNQTIYIKNINGIELVLNTFTKYLKTPGTILLELTIILFAISTIISGYYYGKIALEELETKTQKNLTTFKLIIVITIFIGGIISSNIIWSIVDTIILYLLLINIYAIIKLRHKIK